MKKLVTLLLLIISTITVAQDVKVITKDNDLKLAALPYYSYGKGLGITSPDSLFQLNIRFRIPTAHRTLIPDSERRIITTACIKHLPRS